MCECVNVHVCACMHMLKVVHTASGDLVKNAPGFMFHVPTFYKHKIYVNKDHPVNLECQ